MSREDLLADLQGEVGARPADRTAAAPPVPGGTPALDVSLTPLQWSLPRLLPSAHGVGLAVHVGPVVVSVGVR